MSRSSQEVFDDHLDLALSGNVETDLQRNFSPDCVLITSEGVFHGYDGIREAARLLAQHLPEPTYRYRTRVVQGELAFLEWSGEHGDVVIHDGADSFVA
jgi:hypothetical protein